MTQQIVTGYREGVAFPLLVDEVECGKLMDFKLVQAVRDAFSAWREDGRFLSISSAFRTWDEQETLYNGFKAGKLGFNPADPPGWSVHQQGAAIDIHFHCGSDYDDFAAMAIAHGFSRPVAREPWHFVVADTDKTPPEGIRNPLQGGNT